MGIKFGDVEGKAKKNESFTFKDGDQSFRMIGEILPRYLYWVKGKDNKDIPIECLGFDRVQERFLNAEKDWVREYWPELKCSWAYAVQAIDLSDGKLKIVNLKKKLFEQILTAAEDLGDPTDLDNGWDVVFKRSKTGPHAFNVEYTLQVLRCKKRPLKEEERALIAEMKNIDELIPRLTSDEQKDFIEKKILGNESEGGDAPASLKGQQDEPVDDIPM